MFESVSTDDDEMLQMFLVIWYIDRAIFYGMSTEYHMIRWIFTDNSQGTRHISCWRYRKISMIKNRGNIDCWEAVRSSVEKK